MTNMDKASHFATKKPYQEVNLLLEWQNVVKSAAAVLPFGTDPYTLQIDPIRLSRVFDRRLGQRSSSSTAKITRLDVFTGIHSPFRNRRAHDALEREIARWQGTAGLDVHVHTAQLSYDPDGRYHEKEIDAMFDMRLVDAAAESRYGTAILFTNDRDHKPWLDRVRRQGRIHIELACWGEANNALWQRGMWVHRITGEDLRTCSGPYGDAA
ncbi:hypothetical protein [Rhodococcus pyridinivorans]